MIVTQTLAFGLFFLMIDIFLWSKRKSQYESESRGKYAISFRFPALLFFSAALFQIFFATVISPNWEQTSFLLYPLIVYTIIQIRTYRECVPCILMSLNPDRLHGFFFTLGLIYFVCLLLQLNVPGTDDSLANQLNDNLLSCFIFVLSIVIISTLQLTFHENGLVYGFIFIHWSKFRSWKWNPQNPNHLILSTNSFLLPYVHMTVTYEQNAEVEQILRENAPHALCLQTEKPYTSDPPQMPKNPYFDARD